MSALPYLLSLCDCVLVPSLVSRHALLVVALLVLLLLLCCCVAWLTRLLLIASQRERHGWMADSQVASAPASLNFDSACDSRI